MSLLSGLGGWLRNAVDDIGSVVTGAPAHSNPQNYYSPPPQVSPHPIAVPQGASPQQQQLITMGNAYRAGMLSPQTFQQGVTGAATGGLPLNQTNEYHNPGFFQRYSPGNIASQVPRSVLQWEQGLGQNLVRWPVEVAATAKQLVTGQPTTWHFTPREQNLIGNAPVQSQVEKVRSTYQGAQQGKHPGFAGLAAGAEGVFNVAQDLPLATRGLSLGKAAITKGAEAAHATAEAHPAVQQLTEHLNTLNKLRDQMSANGLSENHPAVRANAQAYSNALQARNEALQAVKEGGYAKLPGGTNEQDQLVQHLAQQYPSTEAFIKDTAESLYNYDRSAKGGQLQKVDELGGAGQYVRTSEHSPFYRRFYEANGRAPSKTAFVDAVRQELEQGKSNLLHPDQHEAYQLIKDREQSAQNLKQAPEVALPTDAQGNPMLPIDRTKLEGKALSTPSSQIGKEPRIMAPTSPSNAPVLAGQVAADMNVARKIPIKTQAGYRYKMPVQSAEEMRQSGRQLQSPESYAETFGVTLQQAEKDLTQMRAEAASNRELAKSVPNYKSAPSIAERRQIIRDNPQQQTANYAELNVPEGNVRGAIAQATGAIQERAARFADADRLKRKLDLHDRQLLYRYDNGEPIEQLAQEAHKPNQFLKASDAAVDALDYSLAIDRAGGGATLRQNSYIPHYYKATEEWMNANDIPEDQRIKIGKQYGGFRDDSAKYSSYTDAKTQSGLDSLYNDPFEAVRRYGESGYLPIRNNLLMNSLAKAAPNDVADLRTVGMNGQRFSQAAGNLPFSVSDRLQPALNAFKKEFVPKTKLGQLGYKTVVGGIKATKKSLFFLTPFHYANEEAGFMGATVFGGHPAVFVKGTANALFSQVGGYGRIVGRAREDGTLDWIRKSGTPFKDIAYKPESNAVVNAARRVNIVAGSNRKLTEFGNALTIQLARFAKGHGIDPTSVDGTRLGAEYGKIIGNLNEAVQGISPNVQRGFSIGALAPYWLRTRLGLVKDAIEMSARPSKATASRGVGLLNAGDVARSAVIGQRAISAAVAIIGSMIATEQFPTLKQVINQSGLNPNNPVPNIEGNSRNKKGEKWVQDFPTDPLGLATMAVSDPQHFASSRYSPLVATGVDLATNRNWNGQPMYDRNQPNWVLKAAEAGGKNLLPISVQNATNPDKSVKQGIVEDFGLRYKLDPNDPQVKANKDYFNALKQTSDDLKQNGQYGQYWAQQFANLHPTNTTDLTGTKYPTPFNPVSSEQKYAAYTAVDSNNKQQILSPVFYADQKLANMTPGYPSSPLYKLTGNGVDVNGSQAPQALVALQYQHAQDPAAKTVIMNANGGQNGWLAKYENQVGDYSKNYQQNLTNYFQGLGWTPKAINDYWSKHPSTPAPIDQVNLDQHTTDLLNQYYQLQAGGDSTAASKFFSSNSAILGNAFDLIAQHANALRSAKGELQLQGYPPEPDHVKAIMTSWPSGSDKASKAVRGKSIQANPDVAQYLADIALYEVLSKGAQFRYKNPSNMAATEGQNINAGGNTGQVFLKNTVNLGKYDIGLNPTTGQYSFMQGGGFPAGSSAAGGGGGRSRHRTFRMIHRHPKRVHVVRPRHPKLYLKRPVSPIKIKNRVNQHPGINRTTYL